MRGSMRNKIARLVYIELSHAASQAQRSVTINCGGANNAGGLFGLLLKRARSLGLPLHQVFQAIS